jgi:DNA-binding MarR family transcriptional regulator
MKKRSPVMSPRDATLLRRVAMFRYELRRFLRFSERAARASGVTPQQHQLLLGLAGFAKDGSATISELAEFLQERHNAVVGLVERAAKRGLVRKERNLSDNRVVQVSLLRPGVAVLKKLTQLHLNELRRMRVPLPKKFDPRSSPRKARR